MGGFVPFRRRVRYLSVHEVPLDVLEGRLALCAGSGWGAALRRGHLPLAVTDLAAIARAMGAPAEVIAKMAAGAP